VTRPPLAEALDLEPHPEGGWFRRTWTSPTTVDLPDGRRRPTATMILFLLAAGETSAWHRVRSTETWLAHTGSVALEVVDEAGRRREARLGTDLAGGEQPQVVVEGGCWQRTLPGVGDALVSCVVSPGFDFADFELGTRPGPG
jgi:predicted cupin superfamily sugar epimerase